MKLKMKYTFFSRASYIIVKFEKWVKYANEMSDDVIHSTQYYIEYINGAILANLQCNSLHNQTVKD